MQVVVVVAGGKRVIAGAAFEGVVAVIASDIVVAGAAVKYVIACMAIDAIVAIVCVDGVRRGIAIQGVVARRGGEHLGLDGGHVPDRAIGELEVLDHIAGSPVGIEVAQHEQAVIAADQADDQIIAIAGERDVGGCDAYAQENGVGIDANRISIVVVDGVLA